MNDPFKTLKASALLVYLHSISHDFCGFALKGGLQIFFIYFFKFLILCKYFCKTSMVYSNTNSVSTNFKLGVKLEMRSLFILLQQRSLLYDHNTPLVL